VLQIPVDKIGSVIGPGGKTIRSIIEQTGASIDIESDGQVYIASSDGMAASKAVEIIESMTREAKVGDIFLGRVVSIKPFGAFVNILPGKDGMVHISELAEGRVNKVEDILQLDDEINVIVTDVDPNTGKISLSRKALLTGAPVTTERDDNGNRGGESRDRGGRRDRMRPRRRSE
jgi:polyribonucleotide nucleotidyltransferase